jgi:HlyD family secretion protein
VPFPPNFTMRLARTSLVRWGMIAASALLAGLLVWRPGTNAGGVDYETVAIDRGDVDRSISATGSVKALVMVDVGTQLSGLITEMKAGFNDRVKAGDVLAVIDRAPYQAKASAAEAELSTARADLGLKEAALLKAETQAGLAKRESVRAATMEPIAAISKKDADQAHTQKKLTASDIVIARAQLDMAKATVSQKQADLEQAQIDLGHTLIRSPINGVVIDRKMQAGQTVAATYQTPILFQIAQDLTQIQLVAAVDEADVGVVRQGAKASFTVEAYPNEVFSGVVDQMRLAATKTSGVVTYPVIVKAQNPGERLFPDMTATVRIVSARRTNALRFPNEALRFRPPGQAKGKASGKAGGEATLWTLDSAGRLIPHKVGLGLRGDAYTEIVSGDLKAGDRIVLRAPSTAGPR